ncbi:malate dehydrogenase (plasmid) [Ketogulonicigenium vulgare Y25]|uniref:Delta(1)-pyrroline-2-carboxylate/Delta(1)-piperideine-2-carboxylate reductase n=1 Tax=Ketogulonicigenium vulgare (strain WSH-001) TaxID=759362 RepID=F9YBH0_KETVW|nr:Ldh family oxidoreductase [Ketogulonicigenium vulgare]ADO44285.1 malate dehydrogenase [Ketogulonicigenium vulgare Y25]AEM42722.1 Malate/L-lactate dehydrogenase family protein [Ketogulonicigenium vulgare WSH-001]ALJ82829.1 lactate dehydrogenase [Ketogulonicigenium vulgare]
MAQRLSFDELVIVLEDILQKAGTSPDVAAIIAQNCAACERDGSKSHGIFRMRGYVSTLASGWVDGAAQPVVEDAAPSFLRVDAQNGFAQPALAAARPLLLDKLRENGAAVLAIRNSHHLSALWPDIEPFADEGYIALSVVNSMAVTVPFGAKRAVFGTNPIAFAAPVAGDLPFVFDMATSAWSHGDVQIARAEGRLLPEGVGVDAGGAPTRDPNLVLEGGALLPFGGHKGSAISMMIELLGAALTGGKFSTEVDWSRHPGAVTPHTGQFILLIDPARGGGLPFDLRAAEFTQTMREAGLDHLPGVRRHKNRAKALQSGMTLDADAWANLDKLRQFGIAGLNG